MMYQDKFVAVVKCNGKILREFDKQKDNSTVKLPFGSEYSLPLENLSNRKALVKIWIDGREVTGGGLIVDPHRQVELKRFIDNDDLDSGYHFKFIQKTKEVQEYRGDKLDDGIIRIEWWYEKELPYISWTYTPPTRSNRWFGSGGSYQAPGGMITSSIGSTNSNHLNDSAQVFCCNASAMAASGEAPVLGAFENSIEKASDDLNSNPLEDEGITVEGSDSDQRFIIGYIGDLEPQSHVIIFKLVGVTADRQPVKKAVDVKFRNRCKQCGMVAHDPYAKFCTRCSARLV